MRMLSQRDQQRLLRRPKFTRWIIAAFVFQIRWIGAGASSSGGSSNPWDFQAKLSRAAVTPQDDSAGTSISDNASAPSTSLVDHPRNDEPSWLQRALTHRLLKPAQFLVPPALRRAATKRKLTKQEQQQQQYRQHQVEVSKNQVEDNSHSVRNSSFQPESRQQVSPSSALQQQAGTEEEHDDVIGLPASPPWASAILAAVSPWFRGRRLVTGIQVGLIAFLLQQVWKAAQEVLEEYTAELNGMGDTTSPGGGALKPDMVERVVQAVEVLQQHQLQQEQYHSDNDDMKMRSDYIKGGRRSDRREPQMSLLGAMPPSLLPWIQLAQNLVAAGLPLRRSHMGHISSVEQVLRTASRTELALLQQCLWTPAASNRPHGVPHEVLSSLSSPFSQIAGLDSAKQRLLNLLLLLQQQQQPHNPATVDDHHHDVSATFDDYSHLLFPSESHASSNAPTSATSKSSNSGPIRAGILLYGPPGCGKTMLVKALASTAQMPCLVVSPSTLLRKFVGDSNQQVRALFTLASKLGNCIICIDELDGLFRQRHDQEHDVTRDLKTEFLQWWDGMMVTMQGDPNHHHRNTQTQDGSTRRPLLVVIGATNRPFDVDPAVLRRLPQSYYIGLPSTSDRLELLHQLIYRNRKVPPSPRRHGAPPPNSNDKPDLDLVQLAMATQGYTPSDIQQLLQTAVTMGPLQRTQAAAAASKLSGHSTRMVSQQLTTQDALNAMAHVRPTPRSASYQRALDKFVQGNNPIAVAEVEEAPGWSASASKWETTWGNFYHIGTLEMDMSSWNVLKQVLFHFNENEDDAEEDSGNQGHAPFPDENYPPQHRDRDDSADLYEEDENESDADSDDESDAL